MSNSSCSGLQGLPSVSPFLRSRLAHPSSDTMGNGAGTTTTYTYSCSDGSRDYDVYTPKDYSANQSVPLVVVLHGCGQSPSIIAADSQFNDLADQEQFIVVYPGQSVSANAYGCWNWYLTDNQSRGSGEHKAKAPFRVVTDFVAQVNQPSLQELFKLFNVTRHGTLTRIKPM